MRFYFYVLKQHLTKVNKIKLLCFENICQERIYQIKLFLYFRNANEGVNLEDIFSPTILLWSYGTIRQDLLGTFATPFHAFLGANV